MMTEQERSMIEGLFEKLQRAESTGAPRDQEAEALFRRLLAQNPNAPYYMAQTILVQEQALRDAEERMSESERAPAASGGGGLFGSLFGGSRPASGGQSPWDRGDPRRSGPMTGSVPPVGRQGGGGFMAGAAQTAMGVAGGMLVANAIGSMFGPDAANAAGAATNAADPTPEPDPQGPQDASYDDGGFDSGGFDGGGDWA